MFGNSFGKMVILLSILAIGANSASAAAVTFNSHDIELTLDVPNHAATFVDRGRANVNSGWNFYQISATADIQSFVVNGEVIDFLMVNIADTLTLPAEALPETAEIDTTGNAKLVVFESSDAGSVEFELRYRAVFHQDVSDIRFSNERVGTEVSGTILEKGAYLSPGAYYYPYGKEELALYKLTANIPEDWESISDGDRLFSDTLEGRKVQTWANSYASDGVYFFAAPFTVGTTTVNNVEIACYFFPEDSGLVEDYLNASAEYVRMYSDLIGPYPYNRFTVVENFFPTGYGMPGWTLLGQRVLRLPFIIRTSLGHEVLHNWWGNSVFVDYETGNWCEGLTVYGADYRYKLMQSQDAARDYRKNILKQYVSYVTDESDFPLREFKSRTSPKTRTIGYNKAMMVFHMVEEVIGTEAFFDAWKAVYAENKGKKVSWEDWIAAFEKTSGMELSYVIPEWIDRPGAPLLAIDIIEEATVNSDKSRIVKFKLSDRNEQNYCLKVPVRFSGADYALDTSVSFNQPNQQFTLTVSDAATTMDLDPDYHLFRKLYPEEVEPVISAVLGNANKRFLSCGSGTREASLREFGLNMTGDSILLHSEDYIDSTGASFAVILGHMTQIPDYLSSMVSVRGDSVKVAGSAYPLNGHTFVLSGQDWHGFGKYLVVLTEDFESLPRIGQLLPHYGKYSYLVFNGPKNVGKGQWEPESSPLRIKLAVAGK